MAKREHCSYCNSNKIHHPEKTPLKNILFFFATAFFDPTVTRKSIAISTCINCNKCHRKYQKIKCEKQVQEKLIDALLPTYSALQNYKDIFDTGDFIEWRDNELQIVQPEKNTLHIIFTLCSIKAYLDCRKIQGRFVIIAVETLN